MRRSIAPAIWLLTILLLVMNTCIAGSNRTWERPSIVPGQHHVRVTADAAGRSPRFALSCWDGEAELGLRLLGVPVGSTMLDTTETKAIWRTLGMQVEYYEIEPNSVTSTGPVSLMLRASKPGGNSLLRTVSYP